MDILTGMRTYLAVVQTGSFTRAADHLNISKALTSKYVNQLEEHLGLRLLQRTTRRLSVTEVGQRYYEQARQIVEDLDNLESSLVDQSQEPRGLIKITAPTTFGELYLTRWIADYLKANPKMQVQLELSDRFVNLIEEGFDLAIRIGQLSDSSLIAKRLSRTSINLYASTDYLAQYGTPRTPEDLKDHLCILDANRSMPDKWQFQAPQRAKAITLKVNGRFQVNSAAAVKQMILAHQGIGLCPAYVMAGYDPKNIQQVLADYPIQSLAIYAIYPQQKYLSLKVRSLIDFLVKTLKTGAPWE